MGQWLEVYLGKDGDVYIAHLFIEGRGLDMKKGKILDDLKDRFLDVTSAYMKEKAA